MGNQFNRLSIRSYLTIGAYEKDEEFKELLGNIARQGMFFIGLLGALAALIFTSSHIFLLGKRIVWHYTVAHTQSEIMIVDKGLIFIFCVGLMLLSRTKISLFWSRLLVLLSLWLISQAMFMDDIAVRDLTVSPEYISFSLIMATVGIPYSGWQTALVNLFIISSTVLAAHILPVMYHITGVHLLTSQVIYLFMVAVVLTGISSLVYLSRYQQYRARRNAEELKSQLEERAHTLEILRAKSEQQAQKILEQEQLKNQFFANVNHELRTPLTLILGPLKDFLSDETRNGKISVRADLLSLMHRNGVRLLQLINQLLDLSKIDAGEIKLDLYNTDLNELVGNTVLSFKAMAEAKKITLSYHGSDRPIIAKIDPQRLEGAIGNLVSNAIKFTPEGGTICVDIAQPESSENKIYIKVTDSGIGISHSDLPHIFDRFYQAAQPSILLSPGTGIGLALVKEIAELHGGTVSVNSTPGEGSEFVLELNGNSNGITGDILPEVHAENTREAENADGEWILVDETTNKSAPKDATAILIVDDNPDVLIYLKEHLSGLYNVTTLKNSDKAIETMKEQKMDLLISDVMMPDPDGFELCRLVKQDEVLSHIPVILLTARAGEESKLEGLQMGADDYISKPFSASELLVRIENLIELRRKLREKFTQQVRIEGKGSQVDSADERFLKKIQSVIDKYMEDSNFSVERLAEEINVSPRQLQRKVRSVTNFSAAGYIRYLRLERASQLLEQNWGNVSEVSLKVGFQDTKYFSRLFKQTFGNTPSEFAARSN